MSYKQGFILLFILCSLTLHSQDKLFFNRIHYFEHQDCQHPIGTVVKDKIFFANNTNNSVYMDFYNTESKFALVELINYGKYAAFNQFVKKDFISANTVLMGFKQSLPSVSRSIQEASSGFKVDQVKDSILNDKTLKHIKIVPKDTLVHRFESYNILINTHVETELPLYTTPTVYFLLLGSLNNLSGTVVETYFLDLEGYIFCRDILLGHQITNKRITIK
ncbi:hypothetical protein [Psychroflexus tropicus]|uniref:hypothetical protein n=1 Tax=Psychroflexus tropicus TaxID=197345 RepID=UPI000525DCD3|nr:hypothetical protein [Psychroflexus tropicus]